MPTIAPLHLAVAFDGAGWHPAAWREPDARPLELFDATYWADQVRTAEHGLLDLVTIEDSLALQSDHPTQADGATDRVRGRLDAVLVAARVAPLTSRIGVVPTTVVTHTEPFHVSKAIATLDYVSSGRAGVRVKVGLREDEAAHVGRRTPPGADDAFDEARDWVEVVRRLWDSWEDDAEIRDVASGRFVDIDKLHYIDFAGRQFAVRGPSITPRPPQGQPVVALLAHRTLPYRLAATSADLVFVTPDSTDAAGRIVSEIRHEQEAAGRGAEPLHVFGDLVVVLGASQAEADGRLARLNDRAGEQYRSDAEIFCGTASDLADLLLDRATAGLSGFRLRPAAIPHDLHAVTTSLVPELQRRGAFRTEYEASTLRGLLGLARPANRYAAQDVR